jgi:glycosyltransferase involved in cell wall biosynthesis
MMNQGTKLKVVHVMERFNPMLGQEINVLSKNKGPGIELYIVTTDSLSVWNITDPAQIFRMDREYEEKYSIRIIRNPVLFEKGEKVWVRGLLRTVRAIGPDVVYSHGVEYISFFRFLLKPGFTRKYVLVTDTHSLPQFATGSLFRKVFYTFLRKIIVPAMNRRNIIAFYTAGENYHLLQDIYGIRKELIRPFLIGADLATFYYDPAVRKEIRQELRIADGDLLVLFTGRLCEAKAPHLIPPALREITEDVPFRIHLLLIGFRDDAYMARQSAQFDPKDGLAVTILPPVPAARIRDYFSASDVAVYPAESTLSSLEAQACRLPVIMEDNPTNRQRCSKGGLLFSPGDTSDLTAKLKRLILEPGLRKKLSEEGFEHISKEYNYLENIRKMEKELFLRAATRKNHGQEFKHRPEAV